MKSPAQIARRARSRVLTAIKRKYIRAFHAAVRAYTQTLPD